MNDPLDMLMRILIILSKKEKSIKEVDGQYDAMAAGVRAARLEVQNLMTTEFGYTRQDIFDATKQGKGKYPCFNKNGRFSANAGA